MADGAGTMHITIERLAYGGDGVGRMPDGRTAFAPGTVPGDIVEAEAVVEHARYVNLRVNGVVEESPDRVKPPCPYFGICGGCQWQHIGYTAQLSAKRAAVADALERIGHIETTVEPCEPSPLEYGYRNKIELSATGTGPGLKLGFMRSHTSEIVPVDACLLLPNAHRKATKALAGALRYLGGGRPDLEIVRAGLRISTNFKDVEVAVWTAPGPFPRQLAARALAEATHATGVVRILTKGDIAERRISGVEVLRGKGSWKERIGPHTMLVSGPSFFQVNTRAAERLVAIAVDALSADGSDRVLDLYAGVGTFTLPLALLAGEVVAVEQSGSALADLRRNLDAAQAYAEIAPGDAARALADLGRFDLALVDPPRAGMSPDALNALLATDARRIVYVSCDPATLARDSSAFAAHGYRLAKAVPVDLFPQTYHVE
ncbi:23S rRNA (uracil(1939)-C(5))-methyltransferase RlmD, partial [bacterium]|nr:23S rRNA (uracil(1939)-C(5))-methyltransferase RlmD [bacterium]